MRIVIFIISFLNFFSFSAAIAENDIVTKVLNSTSLEELRSVSGYKDTLDQHRYIWSIPDKLIQKILQNPDDNNNWEALHKFGQYTDGGLSSMYADACFDAIKTNPLVYYNRFISGDDKALERFADAMRGYLIDDYGKIHAEEIENRKFIDRMMNLIKKQPSSSSQSKRHKNFITFVEDKYENRKQEFREYFGELKKE